MSNIFFKFKDINKIIINININTIFSKLKSILFVFVLAFLFSLSFANIYAVIKHKIN